MAFPRSMELYLLLKFCSFYKRYVELTIMNYNGAEGLEFGGGNTKVDPIVAASMSMTLAKSTVLLLRNVQIYQKTVK